MKKTDLQIKLLAIATLNCYATKFVQEVEQHLQPHIGKDIFKVDGSLKQKYSFEKSSYDGFEGEGENKFHYSAHYWIEVRHNRVTVETKICVNGGSYDVRPSTAYTQYETSSFKLFRIDETGKLMESPNKCSLDKYLTDYTEDVIKEAAEKVNQAKQAYMKAVEKVPYPFRDVMNIKSIY